VFVRFMAVLCLAVNVSLMASSVTVRVLDPFQQPISGAEIVHLQTGQVFITDEAGAVTFDSPEIEVPEGSMHVLARARGFQPITTEVTASDSETTDAETSESESTDIQLQPMPEEKVTMTVTGSSRSLAEVSQTVDVLTDAELDRLRQTSLGETLSTRPGISATAFGTVASRPIIRGLSGDRIRVLEGGLGTGDVSTTSVDHAITVDMAGVQRVEILRGPSTLRYGGSALGGVVNLLDDRIPGPPTDEKLHGDLLLEGDTVSDSRSGRLALNGGRGGFARQNNGTASAADDYRIPGQAGPFSQRTAEHNGWL